MQTHSELNESTLSVQEIRDEVEISGSRMSLRRNQRQIGRLLDWRGVKEGLKEVALGVRLYRHTAAGLKAARGLEARTDQADREP